MSLDHLENQRNLLEEEFFLVRDRELLEKMREEKMKSEAIDNLAAVSGIGDRELLEELHELGIGSETLSALALLPLVEVAWADAFLDKKERAIILDLVAAEGIKKGSSAYGMIESWLKKRPKEEVRQAWKHYAGALGKVLKEPLRTRLVQQILGKSKKVAEASGGFYGVGKKTSQVEQLVLAEMEAAFNGE